MYFCLADSLKNNIHITFSRIFLLLNIISLLKKISVYAEKEILLSTNYFEMNCKIYRYSNNKYDIILCCLHRR